MDHNVVDKLRELRKRAVNINATVSADLLPYFLPNRSLFVRLPSGSDDKGNVTNTCSCLMALHTTETASEFIRTAFQVKTKTEVQSKLTEVFEKAVRSEWMSSGLVDDNAFTALIVLRTGALLSGALTKPVLEFSHPRYKTAEESGKVVKTAETRSLKELIAHFATDPPNTFSVDKYPPTPGIAYWFVDAVDRLSVLPEEEPWLKIVDWTSGVFARQLSLVSSQHDAMKDPVALMLAATLAARLRKVIARGEFDKRDRMVEKLPTIIEIEQAILTGFDFQEPSGIWPKYFPLFNYKKGGAGSNYLFSFEVLEAVTEEFERSHLLEHPNILRGFERALDWCESNRLTYRLNGKSFEGWNAGGQIETLMQGKPEAWTTAVVHMFLRRFQTALSYMIRKHALRKYRHAVPVSPRKDSKEWDKFIDSPIELKSEERTTTVKQVIQRELLESIETTGAIGDRRSALLFGPPGTSKTSLVRAIAKRIGWPLVELNPSHFLEEGLENIYSKADEIFTDLQDLSSAVVFFDEMDALAQKRAEGIDVTRQFLTTSMLPKLSMLHDENRVLFFMATNHQRHFDEAIKRPGRFDLLICMAPPAWNEKLNNLESFWSGKKNDGDVKFVSKKLAKWVPPNDKLTDALDLFTFSEFKSFLEALRRGGSLRQAIADMDKKSFSERVEQWATNHIALRPQKLEEGTRGEISLRDEFEIDKQASLKQ